MQHRALRQRKDWLRAQQPHRARQPAPARRPRMGWLRVHWRRKDFPPHRDLLQAPRHRGLLQRRGCLQHKGCRRYKDFPLRKDLAQQRPSEPAPERASSS